MIVIDRYYRGDSCIGFASYKEFQFFTLELPYLNNEQNISAIHPGLYKAKKYLSPKFQREVILLEGVPNRSWIEFHTGNYTSQIEGCILPGDGIKYLNSDGIPDVTNSTKTLDKLLSMLPDEFEVSIT